MQLQSTAYLIDVLHSTKIPLYSTTLHTLYISFRPPTTFVFRYPSLHVSFRSHVQHNYVPHFCFSSFSTLLTHSLHISFTTIHLFYPLTPYTCFSPLYSIINVPYILYHTINSIPLTLYKAIHSRSKPVAPGAASVTTSDTAVAPLISYYLAQAQTQQPSVLGVHASATCS